MPTDIQHRPSHWHRDCDEQPWPHDPVFLEDGARLLYATPVIKENADNPCYHNNGKASDKLLEWGGDYPTIYEGWQWADQDPSGFWNNYTYSDGYIGPYGDSVSVDVTGTRTPWDGTTGDANTSASYNPSQDPSLPVDVRQATCRSGTDYVAWVGGTACAGLAVFRAPGARECTFFITALVGGMYVQCNNIQ